MKKVLSIILLLFISVNAFAEGEQDFSFMRDYLIQTEQWNDNQSPKNSKEVFQIEKQFQEDADLVRLFDLGYWAKLIEDYQKNTGYYPFQNKLQSQDDIILVKVATNFQRQYLSAGGKSYMPKMDNNKGGRFNEKSIKQFVSVLEQGLNKNIYEKYDIQKVPTVSPIGYNYFVTKDGYLFWVTCLTCGVTPISTLLMDGLTPTVNIASSGMVDKITKAKTREEMLSNPIFQQWISRPFHKEKYIKQLVEDNSHDTKKLGN